MEMDQFGGRQQLFGKKIEQDWHGRNGRWTWSMEAFFVEMVDKG
jgi:hypothetical protein